MTTLSRIASYGAASAASEHRQRVGAFNFLPRAPRSLSAGTVEFHPLSLTLVASAYDQDGGKKRLIPPPPFKSCSRWGPSAVREGTARARG